MDGVDTLKILERKNAIIRDKFYIISSDFSTPYVISHFPPFGSNTGYVGENQVGNSKLTSLLLSKEPEILFHGHSEIQKISKLYKTEVVSVGSFLLGQYVILDINKRVLNSRTSKLTSHKVRVFSVCIITF